MSWYDAYFSIGVASLVTRHSSLVTRRLSVVAFVAPRAGPWFGRLPGVFANQRHEAHFAQALGMRAKIRAGQPQEDLFIPPANRDHQPPAFAKLLAQRAWHPRRRRRDHNCVEWRVGRQPGGSIAVKDCTFM